MNKSTSLKLEYNEILNDYKKKGIIEEISENDNPRQGEVHYLSHKAVCRENRETTKTRIVFDASARIGSEPSLNELLYSGPCLPPYLFDILLRFRIGRVALASDIEQVFLQIEINEQHRDFLRFLWYNEFLTNNTKLTVYRFARVIFGTNCSSFLLSATIREHMTQYKEVFHGVDLIQKFLRDIYVDDCTSLIELETA